MKANGQPEWMTNPQNLCGWSGAGYDYAYLDKVGSGLINEIEAQIKALPRLRGTKAMRLEGVRSCINGARRCVYRVRDWQKPALENAINELERVANEVEATL